MKPILSALAALAMTATAPAPAHAAQLCGWLVETLVGEDFHDFELWLEADADLAIYYQLAGRGVSDESSRAHSPGSGTFSLDRGEPAKPWGFGTSVTPPGEVDIVAEIHAPPQDIFSDEPTPLLATFTFRRRIPEGEAEPPAPARQCVTLAAAP